VEKYCRAEQAKSDDIVHRIACWIPKATHTLTIYNYHYFSTTTTVARTRLNVRYTYSACLVEISSN